ncbi:MAG: Hsp70 family protein [Polyangiaceae bacterium]
MSTLPILGIDLGTTHTAVASVDPEAEGAKPGIFPVPQLVAPGEIDARPLLPSFLYFAHESEGPQSLPWDKKRTYVVGEHARARGVDAPLRVVASAKSWLSHAGVDRRGAVLPAGAPEDVTKVSPVEASLRTLEHLAEAWNQSMGKKGAPFADHPVVLTVPASFDAAARELTAEAASRAGITNLTLLEEPQAALYAWIDAMGDSWRKEFKVGDVVLVVDIGGGTTDFSAICATENGGSLELARVAVGDHILLGGDNMDLALAHVVRTKLAAEGKELDRWQMTSLTHSARGAKELLLGDPKAKSAPITIPSRGAKLVGGSIRTELTREEVIRTLVEGFFPEVDKDARPEVRARVGLTQLGLPYAQDAAVTRHLAAFLARQADATSKLDGFVGATRSGSKPATMLAPTAVLFNGGVMKSTLLRERIMRTLNDWLEADGAPPARVLDGADLDLAVARGAAAYGRAKLGKGVRIRGGTARSYYVGIEGAVPAVPGVEPPITAICVAPFGMEEGTSASLPAEEVGVVVGEPVRFRFLGSTVRRGDAVGTALESWKAGELEELAPICVTLPADGRKQGDVVPVRMHATVTEVGTLLLEAVPRTPKKADERWRVELSVRADG